MSATVSGRRAPQTVRRTPSSLPRGLLRQARPKQWVKNALVLVAPGAAGVLGQPATLGRVTVAVAAFCLVSSGTYFLNDVRDAAADRLHPVKRYRPIASGQVPRRLGAVVGVLLLVAGLGLAAVLGTSLLAVVAIYVATSSAYSFVLKQVPVVELVAVAAGFVLRAIGGGVAAEVPLSQWFLIVASFSALFVVAGKRHSELVRVESSGTRAVLAAYTVPYLRYVWMLASAVTVTSYTMWAFTIGDAASSPVLYELSIAPFVLGLLRYALLLEQGEGGAPEDVLLADRQLLVVGALWVAVFGAAVTVG